MFPFRRLRDILLAPSATWLQVAEETTDARTLYTAFLLPLATLAALAAWFGLSVVGYTVDGAAVHLSPLGGLLNAATSLVLSLVAIHLLARFADRLAPNFGGQSDRLAALRLIAYSSSAALLGGVFAAVPTWAGLGLAPTLYSALILARGIPVLMRKRSITHVIDEAVAPARARGSGGGLGKTPGKKRVVVVGRLCGG